MKQRKIETSRTMAFTLQIAILAVIITISFGEVKISPEVSDLLIKEGSSQTLTCSAKASNQLEWDFPLKKNTGVSIRSELQSGNIQKSVLEIANFTSDRAGAYTCQLRSGSEVISEAINLVNVRETKKEPTYHFGNTTAVLACSIDATGNGDYTVESVTWLKGDTPVPTDGGRFTDDFATNSLTISNPTRDDIGLYTASIKVRNIEAPYQCEVNYKDEVLDVNPVKIEPTFYHGNETGTLSCNINTAGRTIKSVVWLKNDTLISDLKNPERFVVQSKNNTLIIEDPDRDDAGLYIARFNLVGLPEPYDCKVMYKALPFVLDFKKSKNLIEKDTMELQCQVKGYPKPVVTWYKNKAALNVSQDSRIKLEPLNGYKNARLIIKDIAFSDEGQYSCEAFSSFFNESASKEVTVRVKDKLAALWPFLGIVLEVIILCTIIFIYEKRRNKQAEQEENNAQEADGPSVEKKDGLRHRNTPGNPGA